ncbi:MAG: hypothetical protein Q8L26_09445 [Candidatus Omnitrophota bacterium]|nr:hypothetical protein [Candidatus Omnitrophota bacterium]
MARKDHAPEPAIEMLREADVQLSQGEKIGNVNQRRTGTPTYIVVGL